jgi:hypothetical protein
VRAQVGDGFGRGPRREREPLRERDERVIARRDERGQTRPRPRVTLELIDGGSDPRRDGQQLALAAAEVGGAVEDHVGERDERAPELRRGQSCIPLACNPYTGV